VAFFVLIHELSGLAARPETGRLLRAGLLRPLRVAGSSTKSTDLPPVRRLDLTQNPSRSLRRLSCGGLPAALSLQSAVHRIIVASARILCVGPLFESKRMYFAALEPDAGSLLHRSRSPTDRASGSSGQLLALEAAPLTRPRRPHVPAPFLPLVQCCCAVRIRRPDLRVCRRPLDADHGSPAVRR
jgi:hypothetical protein